MSNRIEISKKKLCGAYNSGSGQKELATLFSVSVATINKYIKILEEEGLLQKRNRTSRIQLVD